MNEINKVKLFYFSGTGNALKVSNWFSQVAQNNNLQSEIINISYLDSKKFKCTDEKTLIGFIYPTHGFNAVPQMLHFIFRFRSKNSRKVFLMNTRAGGKFFNFTTPGLSGIALLLPMLILFLKGFKIIAAKSSDMPSNWTSIHPGYSKKWIDDIQFKCERNVKNFAEKVLSGERYFLRSIIELPFDLLISPISVLYYFIGRFFLAKLFLPTDKCNSCYICLNNCPVGAIKKVDGRPFWTYKCESCMKCINFCPQKSVQVSHLFVLIGILLFNIPLTLILIDLLKLPSLLSNYLIVFVVDNFILLIFYFLFYRFLHFFMKYKVFNNIIKYTSLTYFWRGYKNPGVKLKDFNN